MKIHIGPYLNYYGPYQIAEILLFFLPDRKDEHGFEEKHPFKHKFGNFLAYGNFKGSSAKNIFSSREDRTWFDSLCEWIHSKRQRKVYIHIDRYDHGNAHTTMSQVILPVLKSLKEHKHGHGWIDDDDAPEHLRSTYALESGDSSLGNWDSNSSKRYEWFLDEIIWTFEQDQPDNDWEEKYWSGDPSFSRKLDQVGYEKHYERMQNGMRLFGKYYYTLWD